LLNIADVFLISAFSVASAFLIHNLFVTLVGMKYLQKNNQEFRSKNTMNQEIFPHFSIVLPVKNEHSVIERLLKSLLTLNYPSEKLEIVIVEDGSNDGTFEICNQFAASHKNVKLLQRSASNGKPSALNYAIKHCSGEIIGFFDADAVPDCNALLKAVDCFADPSVAAVQGRNLSINFNENILTRLATYEDIILCEAYLEGKDALGLFVNLRGSCQFIRADVLRQLGGFDEAFLSEDIEISARITEMGHRIRYCSDLRSWQETPSKLRTFLKQRIRWYTGYLQVAFKYRRLLSQVTRRSVDAEVALFAPTVGAISLVLFSGAFIAASFLNYSFDPILKGLLNFSIIGTLLTLCVFGFALVCLSKPREVKNLVWFPLLYAYLNIEVLLTLYAALLVVFRRSRGWTKTEKSGAIANPIFNQATN
jgi:cellulose synthase/poly-beta-1,6-N-acetylglucosamine synthase-like glycosyltransferase